MPVQNGPSLPLNKENGYFVTLKCGWDDVSIAIKLKVAMSSCVCTYDKLPWPKSEVRYAMHSHTLHADTEDPSKNLHILFPCPLFQILCMRSSSNFTACKNSQNWTINKIWREHMAQRHSYSKHWTNLFQLFFPSFTKQVANFPTWIHLSMAGSHDLWSEKCVWGCFESKTHCFDQIMLAPL